MAKKGINTIILESKDSIVNTVNNCIKAGVPASIVSIMMDNILVDLNSNIKKILEMEKQEYEKQLETESNQIEYVPEEENGIKGQNEEVN